MACNAMKVVISLQQLTEVSNATDPVITGNISENIRRVQYLFSVRSQMSADKRYRSVVNIHRHPYRTLQINKLQNTYYHIIMEQLPYCT